MRLWTPRTGCRLMERLATIYPKAHGALPLIGSDQIGYMLLGLGRKRGSCLGGEVDLYRQPPSLDEFREGR